MAAVLSGPPFLSLLTYFVLSPHTGESSARQSYPIMKREIVEGRIQGNERGYGFLIPDDPEKSDYFVPHGELKGAMHGDRVIAETTDGAGERTTARVLKIISRGIQELVGTYFTCKSGGFVTPDDSKFFTDVFVPFGKGLRARAGDKVVCRILAYPKKKNPEGIVSKILGRQFDKTAELKSIAYNYKLPDKFPSDALAEADAFPQKLDKSDKKNRKDFRKLLTVTIDGEDARDFDDAVSVEKKGNCYVLGVHIADVTDYVKSGDALDREAFERGTSVYFPEKVIPMLPERLCNGLCSLKEDEERLTLSCVMTIDENGNRLDSEIVPSVIKSKKRLTYTTVQKIFDGDKKAIKSNAALVKTLLLMRELADVLEKKRRKNGSVDLEVKESAITVENGEINVVAAKKDAAHGLIEEFMIAANCAVAEYMFYLDLPFVYRVHGKPTEERLERFYAFLDGLGVKYKRKKDEIYPKDFQTVLNNAANTPAFTLINRIMLRTMQKAKYSTEPEGHFGLGEKHYCHFTSPIRRYPDLLVHRIIKDFLENGTEGLEEKYRAFFIEAAAHSSEKEKNAEEAERAVDDYYKILYIDNYVGEEFDGIISGVIPSGIFVELENGVEGLVKVETLKGKRYECDRKAYTLSNGKTTYKLGQSVKICVAGVNIVDKRAEFVLCDDNSLAKNKKKL